jgi:hypothetical protein
MKIQITIHGKRMEETYPFTVRYKGQDYTGRVIYTKEYEDDEPIGLDEELIEFDREDLFDRDDEEYDELKDKIADFLNNYRQDPATIRINLIRSIKK